MGCGCGGAARNTVTGRAGATFPVVYADGTVRRYLTEMEQQAAIRASQRTANPATAGV